MWQDQTLFVDIKRCLRELSSNQGLIIDSSDQRVIVNLLEGLTESVTGAISPSNDDVVNAELEQHLIDVKQSLNYARHWHPVARIEC
jgi:hypothetical protein